MKQWILLILEKFGALNLFLVFGVIISSFSFKFSAENMQSLTTIGDGVQTCFSRVQQSFTARLLGQRDSVYLTKDFLVDTESCLGELASEFPENFRRVGVLGHRELNVLATNTHRLHEDIDPTKSSSLSALTVNGINRKFGKLENSRDIIVSMIDNFKVDVENSVATWSLLLYLMIFAIIGVLWKKLHTYKKADNELDFIEQSAFALLNSDFEKNESKSLLEDVLRKENYQKCAQLFSRYQIEMDRKVAEINSYKSDEIPKNLTSDAMALEKELALFEPVVVGNSHGNLVEIKGKKKINTTVSMNIPDVAKETISTKLQSIHLETMLSKTIDMLSSKIFTQGIIIAPNIASEIYVMADEESLQQVLYHCIHNSIQACSTIIDKKIIKISCSKVGNTVLLNFSDCGTGFSPELIKKQEDTLGVGPTMNIGLSICNEFMAEFGGKVNFENITNDMELIIGGKLQLVFRSAEKCEKTGKNKKVVSIQRGSKKELLKRFGQDAV